MHIHINKDEKFEISYGSGLNNLTPSKSPLLNNLNFNHSGDIGVDLDSPDES